MLNLLLYYGLPKDLAREKRCNLAKRKKEKKFQFKKSCPEKFIHLNFEWEQQKMQKWICSYVCFFFISASFYFEFISSVVILYISWLVTKTVYKNNENLTDMLYIFG